jgi:molybdate transport system ATP-binding protein
VISFALELPLARFTLHVAAQLDSGVMAVMGPSGAGKTSLLEAIAGLRRKARGRIDIAGEVVLDTAARVWLPPERRRVGYVPQDAGLLPHLTAHENVRFGARGDRARVDSAIEVLGLGPLLASYPATLSGGEKQRVALARALASAPRFLLLDEPLAALDVALRERILPYLHRIRDEWRLPTLYVTHNVGEALALADRVLLLRDGAVEAVGLPLALLATPALAGATEEGIENLLRGRIAAHDETGGVTRVALDGGPEIVVPLARPHAVGATVFLAIRAEDVLVSSGPITGLSARNVLPARVEGLERTGADAMLRCAVDASARPWLVRLTPAAIAALGVQAGSAVVLAVKSHSIRVIGRGP